MASPVSRQDGPRWSLLDSAVALMNRLTFPKKFALISLLFAVPLGGVMWQAIWEINQRIEFARKELHGTTYLRPLRHLLADLVESRASSRRHSLDGAVARPDVVRFQTQIEQHMAELQDCERRLGQQLDTPQRYEALRENWRGLREQLLSLPPADSDQLHQSLIAEVRDLMKHVGDTSNLILDPDLDSYYQMDAVLLKLPERQTLVAEYSFLAQLAARDTALANEKSTEFMRFAGLLEQNRQDVARGMRIAFENTKSHDLRARLEPLVQLADSEAHQLVSLVRQQTLTEDGSAMMLESVDAARHSFDADLRLWDAAIAELDELLQARIDRFAARRTLILTATGISLLLVVYLWAGFYAAVMRTIAILERAAEQMVEGQFGDEATIASTRDELGKVVVAFNAIARRLRAEWEQARDESTRARAAEIAMREAEARYEGIFENASEGIFQSTPDGRYLHANPALARIYGFDSVAQLLAAVSDIESQLYIDRERRQEFAEQIQQHGFVEHFESQVRRCDGTVIWISESARAVHDTAGKLLYYEGMVQDVTERRRAESRLRAAIKSAPNAMLMVDSEGRIVLANAQVERLFGFSREELLGQDVGLLVPTEFRQRHAELVRNFFQDAQVRMMESGRELSAMRKDGTQFPVEIGLAFLQTEDGTFAIASINDLTVKHEAARKLEAARRAAEEANRAKSEFLANMSHEIRTPMNGIIGMSELLANTPLNKEQRDFLRMVRQSADSLLRLLNDILDFSKIEAGKLELDPFDFSLRNCVGQTGQVLAIRAAEKGLELAYRISPALPDGLIGDAGRLRQIIVNLAGNAIKFTHRGEVVVNVEQESRTDDEIVLHFSVKDTGEGIPADRQDKIFDSFTQADSSTTRSFGGTGLGLTISKQLVNLMKGRIWLESEAGVGSTFHFTAAFGLQSELETHQPAELSSLEGMRVLVVDDNTTNLRIFQELLDSWRMKTTVALSGAAGLVEMERAVAAGQPYRLMILDLMMPEMDGFELAKQVRMNADFSDCSLLMVSSAVRPGDAERCRQLGIERYMTKPVVHAELLDTVLDVVSARVVDEVFAGTPADEAPDARRGLTILLAEDGLVNQEVAVGLLHLKGHDVVVANNGNEAITALAQQSFDVLLMDVQMPELDGFEATRRIRQAEQASGKHTPIIAMTASAMKGDRERCLAAGMDGYVSKPIDPQQLYEVLEEFADKCVRGEEPPPKSHQPSTDSPIADESQLPATHEAAEFDASEVIDLATAVKRMRGGPEHLKRVAGTFLRECEKLMNDIREGIATQDATLVKRGAHTLKGSAGVFSATEVISAAERFESMGGQSNLEDTDQALAELEGQISRLKSALAIVASQDAD